MNATMQLFAEFPPGRVRIRYVLTDIDDTLTHRGRLPGQTYLAVVAIHLLHRRLTPVGKLEQRRGTTRNKLKK